MDVALETPDGRPDFQERKYCNYMTAAYENCTNIIRDCFPQEEINFWIDNDLSNYMDGIEEIYSNWDNQKCPPFRLVKTVKPLNFIVVYKQAYAREESLCTKCFCRVSDCNGEFP